MADITLPEPRRAGWTLRFEDADQEREFLRARAESNREFVRGTYLLALLFHVVFLGIDTQAAGEHWWLLATVRLVLVTPVVVGACFATRSQHFAALHQPLAIALLLAHSALFSVSAAMGPVAWAYMMPGTLTVALGTMFLMKLRFRVATPLVLVLVCSQILVAAQAIEDGGELLARAFVTLTGPITLMLISAWRFEQEERQAWLTSVGLERERARAEAATASRLSWLGEIARVLRHELNTHLAVIRTSLQVLRPMQTADAQPYLERSASSSASAVRLLTRIAEASDLESSVLEETSRWSDVAVLARDVVQELALVRPERRVRLDCAESIEARFKPDSVAQCLRNLLLNADDFAEPGSSIDVRVARVGSAVSIQVINIGPPLATEANSLFQLHVSERRREQGHMGLGLYLVQLVAAAHGGQATARNLAERQVEFRVILPVDQESSTQT